MVGYALSTLLDQLGEDARHSLQGRWQVTENGATAALERAMQDERALRRCWNTLPDLARRLVQRVMARDDRCILYRELVEAPEPGTGAELERAIEELESHGFLFRIEDRQGERLNQPTLALPRELAGSLSRFTSSPQASSPEDVAQVGGSKANPEQSTAPAPVDLEVLLDPAGLTLKDSLDRRHFRGQEKKPKRTAQHARQAYKLFLQPTAIAKRIERLPQDARQLVETAIQRFGGLLPRSIWLQTHGEAKIFADADLNDLLEEALLGRMARVDLRRYGIAGVEDTLIVFQDVTLVHLRSRAAAQALCPTEEHVAGVDLVTNLMRFLRYVDENGVRFTLQGEIFQATKKRMLAQLVVPDEAGEGGVEALFAFLDRFARSRGLIQATGERTLRLSETGRSFEEQGLERKLRDLLAFAVEDVDGGGDPFHQRRLRRIVLRLLRRLEAQRWYDAMHVPFLARNAYLVQMRDLGVREHYDAQREAGRFVARENTQKLAWNLFHWIRQRLHPLGIVDLGESPGQGDQQGMQVSLRLSQLGAALLQGAPAQAAEGARSTLVVNPDFEILLFPDSDVWPLVHSLDRFATRLSSDRLFRFSLSEESLRSALADGMGMGEILDILTLRCRTPLPQNVRFSLEDWATRAGALRLTQDGRVLAPKPELFERLISHARVVELCDALPPRPRASEGLRLKQGVRIEDFRALLRDLGFFLELPSASNVAQGKGLQGSDAR